MKYAILIFGAWLGVLTGLQFLPKEQPQQILTQQEKDTIFSVIGDVQNDIQNLGAGGNTFSPNILPIFTRTYDLGSTTPDKEWKNVYTQNLTVSGTCTGCSAGSFSYPFPSNSTSTLLNFSGGIIASASSTIQNLSIGRSTTTLATTTDLYVGNTLTVDGSFTLPDLTSALILTGSTGVFAEYTGINCTNQFVRDVSALGAGTCETVVAGDVNLADLTAGTGLSAAGTYTGATARTFSLDYSALPTQGTHWATSTTDKITINPNATTSSISIGRSGLLGANALFALYATSTIGNIIYASSTNSFTGNFLNFVSSNGTTQFKINSAGATEFRGNLTATSTGTSTIALGLKSQFIYGTQSIFSQSFSATSTIATSTFFGGVSIANGLLIPSSASTTFNGPPTGQGYIEISNNTATSGLIGKHANGTFVLTTNKQFSYLESAASTSVPRTGTTSVPITTFHTGSFTLTDVACYISSRVSPMTHATATIRVVNVTETQTLFSDYILCTNSRMNAVSATSSVQLGNNNSINDDDGALSNNVFGLKGSLHLERGNFVGTADDLKVDFIGVLGL